MYVDYGGDTAGMGIKAMKSFGRSRDIPAQVPPLTPGTNKKMAEALEASFASWEKERLRLNVTKDPRQWSEAAVAHWLHWAIREFSLEGVAMQPWQHMTGKQICAMGKESFLARAPTFTGDILWEHLEILQKDVDAAKASLENVPANLYESVCVPDLGDFLGYQGGGHQVATPEHKNPPTPANSATSNSSGTPQSGTQQQPPIQPSSGAVSLPSRQYHNDEDDVDDETFLRNAPARNALAGRYQNFDNDITQKHQQLLQRKKEIEERTVQSSERSVSLLRDSEQIGVATAEELIRQREQLQRTEKRLDDINSTLRFSQKHIQGIKSVFGSLKNYLSGKSLDAPIPSTKLSESSSSGSVTSPALSNTLEQVQSDMSSSYSSTMIRGSYDDHGLEDVKPASDRVTRVLEQNLSEMSGSLAKLKHLAIGLSEEIDSQNDLIDNITDKTEKADITLQQQNKDMLHLLKK